jgi:uncharacterized repeat protein (TIGR01451 family)
VRLALGLAAALVVVAPQAALAQGWYDGAWGYRKKITIDNTMVAGDLTYYPVLLNFTDTDLRDKARSDFFDVLFTEDDGTTKLSHDIEDYDSGTGLLVVWVEVTALSGSVDTDIYMYYGNSSASDQEDEAGTWSDNYEAVYHLHNNSFADATGNHDASNGGSTNTTGIAGDGRNFVRPNNYIDTNWAPSSFSGDYTFEGWFRALNQTSSGDIWGVEDRDLGDNSEIRLAVRDTDSNNQADSYDIEVRADGGDIITEEAALPGDPDDGAWHHIALVRSGATARVFYDGVYITLTDSATSSSTASFPSPRTILMGAQWETDAGGPPATRNELNGDLDETRISLTARPQEYFATQVANLNNSAPGGFYDFLSGEESAGLIGYWNFNEGSGQLAADASPSNNDGTLGPTASVESGDPTWACGGTALQFDGSDDEVKLSSVAIGDRAAWSISAWIKMGPDAADKRTIYGEGDTTQREYLYLDVAEAGSYVTFYSEDFPGTVYTQLDGTTNVEDDVWHLVTVVQRSKTDRVLYVDASPEDSSSQDAGTLSFNTASIGYLRSDGWVADPFLGTIDDVRIYDYALNPAEIRDPVDDSLAAYLQAQGLTVVFADDNLTGPQIEDSINAYGVDVMYVSQTCGSSAVDDTYLTNLTIGIVMPNVGNWDGFELANHDAEATGPTTGYIVDNTHYITEPFSTGNITLYSSATPLGWGDMGVGAGAQVLMTVPGQPDSVLIVAYEAGATLETGNPADGRRVGLFTEGEDWQYFTADTKTLIYRSILWGGGLAGGAGAGDAVTSATAEISPNDVTTNDTGVEFIYAILATIGGTDTGVDRVEITVPNSFGLPTVDSVRVGGTAVTYTDNTAARLISLDLDTKLTSTDSIQVYFTADAPSAPDATGQDFTSTVDDSGSGAAAQATTEGSADGDAGDNNSWTVTTTDSGGGGGPSLGGTCPAIVAVDSDTTITTSLSIAHSTSGAERLMLVGVSIDNDNVGDTVSAITYAGQPLSRYGVQTQIDDARVEIWQLLDPPETTANVDITFSAMTHGAVVGVMTLAGVDQGAPLGSFAGVSHPQSDGETLPSIDIPSAVGDRVLGVYSGETVTSVETLAPAAEQWNINTTNGSDEFGAGATDSATTTTTTITWSLGSADHTAMGGVAIKPSNACLNAAPSISSAANQTFQVGDPTTAASTITIAEDTLYQTISDTDDLRVRIPAGLDMIWDTLQTTIVVGGNASTKVGTTVSYEDAGKTAVIDVTTSFAAADTITVDSLEFMEFGSASAADSLELEVKNDGLVSAVDDKTKEITAASGATLLGRYWFNEAPSGQTPDTVFDNQASPVNLAITYDTGVEWVVTDGHRGLNGPNGTHTGVAQADATGTKYQTTLDGASQASFVVVTEWTSSGEAQAIAGFYTSGGTRVVHFGTLTNGTLDIWIRTETQSDLRVSWGGTGFADGTRRVFHVVYDSDDPTPENRVRLFVDGGDQGVGTLASGSWPTSGEALDLSGSISIAALNEAGTVQDATQGTVFYYAVYDGALSAGEISTNATALLADDDNITPTVTVTPDGAAVTRAAGTEYTQEFTIANGAGVTDDFDLLAWTGPASSFITIDSITFNGLSFTAPPDSARLIGLVGSASDTATVWYTVASSTNGRVDTLYVRARSVTDTTVADTGWAEVEFNDGTSATLLGRYWLNEAPSGQGPTTVYDDQPSPVNLTTIVYDTPVEWTVDDGHRGLHGDTVPHVGIAYGTASATKYTTNLDGALEATFVAVAEWAPPSGSSRLAGFVRQGGARIAELVPVGGDRLSFRVLTQAQSLTVTWDGVPGDSTRRVLHLVYDADNPVDSLRLRLYVNGSLLPPPTLTVGTWPGPTEALDFSAADILLTALNNTPADPTNPLDGTVFYYAVYAGMLTDGEISSDATALLADDDNIAPAVAVTPDGLGSTVLRQPGTNYSYDFVVQNTSSILEDYDLLASSSPVSSFITIDSTTFNGLSFTAPPDSARLIGLAAGVSDTITVWYTIVSDSDGNVDSLYLAGRSVTEATVTDDGYIEIEYDEPALTPLVRYWIDEAPSGQGVANLLDSESSPLNMPMSYPGASPYFDAGANPNRHLRFSGASGTDTGGGVVDTDGTKMDAVHGATQVTIEVKYMMDGGGTCSNEGERIFGLSDGDVSTSGWLAVRERAGRDVLQVQWQGQTVGVYALETGCPITSASVVHWVVDTTEPVAADRIRAYIDGVQATVTAVESTSLPSQNETIDLGSGTRRMFVGRNHGAGGFRTFNGRIWYAALYLGEMTDAAIATNATALLAMDDNNTYAVTVAPDGASVARQAGSYSYDFTLSNGSSVLEDFDLLASTDPASSFITIDSITGGGIGSSGVADSTRITGVDAGADSMITVWYTVAADTDGNVDTLYLTGRSISDPAQSDAGWLTVEYETVTLSVAPDGADTLQLLPTGTVTPTSYKFTITNNSGVSETFDLLAFNATVLTVDSITGPNLSGGSPGDSARTGTIAASADDSAFVWFTVSVGTSGALDSLYLMGRSVSEPSATDSGWVFVELLQPNITISKSVDPSGTQLPGTDLTYRVTITNNGNYDAVDVVNVDSLPAEVEFQVGSEVDNMPVAVDIEFSDDNGSSWAYVPTPAGCGAPAGYDACVTHIRWTLLADLTYVAPNNTGNVEYVARIE